MTWVRFWRGATLALTAAEIVALRTKDPEAPLCHTARRTFRLDTQSGKVGFCLGWGLLTALLLPHLCRAVSESSFGETIQG